jgi:TetR/AcrR family transcriptional repressor of lmrAB and yxaGH operons
MPSIPSAASSRDRMLDAAIDLIRGFGLAGAGINDIVRESGAPKGSVYHFFPGGKAQIAEEALARNAEQVQAFIAAALARGRTPDAKVRALFGAFAVRVRETAFRRSCAAGGVSVDLGGDDTDALQRQVAAIFERYTDTIAAAFDLGTPERTRSFAALLLTGIEGAYVRARAERSARPFTEAGEWLAALAE